MTSASTVPEPLRDALAERYAIEREIGAGGMATVYLAQDLKHEREVALKVFRPEVGASFGAERFTREIKLLARLRHPFILPLLDSGETAGALYFMMPYIDGESLRARLAREGRLPIEEAVELARSVADALSYAHGGEARIARAALAMAYSVSGRIAEARQIQTDLGDSPDTPRFQHAMIYAMIGDDEATFDWLERAFVARTDMYTLRAHPAFARMHAQPRFVRLLERLDLR